MSVCLKVTYSGGNVYRKFFEKILLKDIKNTGISNNSVMLVWLASCRQALLLK